MVLTISAFAQKGNVHGSVTDASTGEPIMFANILVKESDIGDATDLDGNYNLLLKEGTYTLVFSYIGYTSLTVTDVTVISGKDFEMHVKITSDSEVLKEITVTAEQVRNTEAALLNIQRKASGLIDGISTQSMRRTGDSDVGAAIKRVTGVSVEDGKYVIVRGLADRYSKTTLNGLEIPGLDPDKNSVQLDIFPTSIVDNIMVHKSFTPDLPADFAGGIVNIVTKDFPERRVFSVSAGGSYNHDMHLNDNFITYKGGDTDYLGIDDGNRKLPISTSLKIPSITDGNVGLTNIITMFNPTMSTIRKKNGMDYNMSAAYGDQLKIGGFSIGYSLSTNYANETTYYDQAQFNTFFKDADKSENELDQDISIRGDIGESNVMWSTQVGTALKTNNHSIVLNSFHSQNGVKKAAFLEQSRFEFGQATLEKHNLEFSERSVSNFLLSGKHSFLNDKIDLRWKASPTFSKLSEPDIRLTAYETTNDAYELNRSTGGGVTRTWRNMDEDTYAGSIDFQYTFDIANGGESKIKAGGGLIKKARDFEILNYAFPVRRRGTIDFSGDPAELWNDNIWDPESDAGIYVEYTYEPSKSYNATLDILSSYIMNEIPLTRKFKVIYGARIEKAINKYTGQRQIINDPATDLYTNRIVLDETDFLPALNMVYTLSENSEQGKTMNIRGAFSQTIARPSFKEKSIAQIEDRITGRTFIGNIGIEETKISNVDLRWEYYISGGQILSISTFYKSFTNPIELTAFDATSPDNFIPRNVGDASLYGIELEARKKLSFLTPLLSDLSIGFNATLVKSEVAMTQEEIQGRLASAREGETIDANRAMVGQSPYIINLSLTYSNQDNGWEGNLSFNTQGKRLAIVGIGQIPDVFERPFNSSNLRLSKRFGAWKTGVSINNILNSEKEKQYQSYGATDHIFELYQTGRKFSFNLQYTL